jgi:glutaredoxin
MPVTEPIRASGPRPTSFPFAALLALVLVLATGGYFMRDRLLAKPEPVLQAQKMSLLMKRETGQGLPAYTVALENERAVARLLPDAKKNLSQFAAEPVVLFSTSWCSYCAEARRVLNAAEVRYKEVDVERDADAMRYHSKVLRAEGVPVIIVGNRVLIGYNETELMLASLGAPK